MNATVRPAAVAGAFYPEMTSELEDSIQTMLANAPRSPLPCPKAIIAPHAGYVYSGPIAASIYAPLQRLRSIVTRVILLGPTHRVAVRGIAVPGCEAFRTPLGSIPLDRATLERLRELPQVVTNDAAHAQEHSLEVQLPFLQTVLQEFSLVPLAVGAASAAEVADVLDHVWGGPETLIVVSSDLSHYHPYAAARSIDERTAARVIALKPDIAHEEACGATPINGLLIAARRHGLTAHLMDLRNSGDTAGDRARVVGYAAFSLTETPGHVI